jgi:hypothetical protein
MTGYCISGIFRKSLRPSFASKLLTLTQLVSIHGGGRHMWEVTSDEVTRFLKVCTFPIYTSVPPTATDDECTGRICRNPLLRSHDPLHQTQPPHPDRTNLRPVQEKSARHLRPRRHPNHLLHDILDPEDPHLRPDLRLLAPGDGQMPRPVGYHPRRLDRQYDHRCDYPGFALASDLVSPNPKRKEITCWRHVGRGWPGDGFQRVAPSSSPYRRCFAGRYHPLCANRFVGVRPKVSLY